MYTILGAGGGMGSALAKELLRNGKKVRLVSRSGTSLPGAEAVKGDISDYTGTTEYTKGSEVVFLAAGLKYDVRVWRVMWPQIMKNTIDACKKNNAKLIFIDNVYSYGKVDGPMTESTPYNPVSAKGEIRAAIASELESEYRKGNLNAIIARAADIYGPYGEKTSFINIMVIDKLINGKKAQLMVRTDKRHTLSYTIDCGKGLYLLSQTPEAFNQVWHLPVSNPAPTMKELVDMVSAETGKEVGYTILNKGMLKFVGLFNRVVKESLEMLYQNEYDYYVDSTKFNEFFKYKPASYKQGVRETVEYYRKIG